MALPVTFPITGITTDWYASGGTNHVYVPTPTTVTVGITGGVWNAHFVFAATTPPGNPHIYGSYLNGYTHSFGPFGGPYTTFGGSSTFGATNGSAYARDFPTLAAVETDDVLFFNSKLRELPGDQYLQYAVTQDGTVIPVSPITPVEPVLALNVLARPVVSLRVTTQTVIDGGGP